MKIDVSYYSSVGGRKNNEDYLSVLKNNQNLIMAVADGLGGHEYGEIASRLAVTSALSALKGKVIDTDTIHSAFDFANKRVIEANEINKMKSTLALLCVSEDTAYAATVGDTRIYHFRKGEIIFQSTDHSVAQMAVTMGEITPSQIRGCSDRNKLLRAVGNEDTIKPDIVRLEVRKGDAFLICSDGFWESILENEMRDLLYIAKNSKDWIDKMRKHTHTRMTNCSDNNSAIACVIGNIHMH